MSNGVNKVILIGHVCRDPEQRAMPSGEAVTNISIACNQSWRDKAGEKKESVEFVNIVFFNKLAEIAGQYLKRGSQVYVDGSLRTRSWEKDGVKRYATEVVAREMEMLGSRPEGERPRAADPAQARAYREASGGSTKSAPAPFDNFEEDDIPW